VSRRELAGFAIVVCVACCIGPILGALGAIGALGVVSTVFIGFGGIASAAAAIGAFVVVRRCRRRSCVTDPEAVAVELTRPTP
jgi:hypothetical protein